MTIVRQRMADGSYELTLINTMRLDPGGLAELTNLGVVKHVVRLGTFHGVDDAFYVDYYDATYWTVENMDHTPGLRVQPEVLSGDHLPLSDAQLFCFSDIRFPEAIIVLPKTPERAGIAITTDAIQNHESVFDVDNSLLVSLGIWRIGLLGPARLGPIWMREQAADPSASLSLSNAEKKRNMVRLLKPQFERLLSDFEFDMLIAGHGQPLTQGAKEAVRNSVNAQLGLPVLPTSLGG